MFQLLYLCKMGIKATLSKPYARMVVKKIAKWKNNPIASQQKIFQQLIKDAANTCFGRDHHFNLIKNYEDFKKQVPIRDYEKLIPYIEKIKAGESDILWKNKPIYFCKTSGTTSGVKYIPLTKESIPNHIQGARDALLSYIEDTGNADFVNGKMIFLQGSPELQNVSGIPTGRLSGIVAHHVPSYLQKNRMPSLATNCIEDWEEKVDKIVEETIHCDMRLISGIPSWVQMYLEKLLQKSGKEYIKDVFPNFSIMVYGGVNFEPYRNKFSQLIGKEIDTVELFPASEGFFAFQDSQNEKGLLLIVNSGIFYEFIPADEYFNAMPTRIFLSEVELGVNYALIINSNAGLWGYSIGDTVKFVSLKPYRIIVSGRIKHFTSAFGEHVIAEEVESSIRKCMKNYNCSVVDFHVAPQVSPKNGLPYHEWLIEFDHTSEDLKNFAIELDQLMCDKNTYYNDLIVGTVLRKLVITPLKRGAFIQYMKGIGKLGGQNKVQRLSNDRKVADELCKFATE